MASLIRKLVGFARSPQGRRLIGEAQKAARDPSTRRRINAARRRLGKLPR